MTFEWLYDGLPEDGIEDHAWLRLDLAATPEEAARKMTELYERDAGPLEDLRYDADAPVPHFATSEREYLRASLTVYDPDDEDDVNPETVYGAAAEKSAAASDALEDLRYEKCEPDDDGATEWWKVALVHPRKEEQK